MYKGALQGRIWNPVRQCKAGSQALARAKLELSEITLICARQGHRLSPPVPGPLLFESVSRYCEKLYDLEGWRQTSAEEKRLCVEAGSTLVALAEGTIAAGAEARQAMHSLLCSLFGTANVNQVPATYADFDLLGGAFSGICKLKCSTKGGLTVVVQEAALLSTQFAAPKQMLAASPLLVVAGGNVAFGALLKLPVDDAHFTAAETYKEVYCLNENRMVVLEQLGCALHAMRVFALACPKREPDMWMELSPWLTRICPNSPITSLKVGYDPFVTSCRSVSVGGLHRPELPCCCSLALDNPSAEHYPLTYRRQVSVDYDDLGASELLFEGIIHTASQEIPVMIRFMRTCPCVMAANALAEFGAVQRIVALERAGNYTVVVMECEMRGELQWIPLTQAALSDGQRDRVVDRLREFEMQMSERGIVHGNVRPDNVLVNAPGLTTMSTPSSRHTSLSGSPILTGCATTQARLRSSSSISPTKQGPLIHPSTPPHTPMSNVQFFGLVTNQPIIHQQEEVEVMFADFGYSAFESGKRQYPLELGQVTGDRREPYGLIKMGDDNSCFQRTIDWIYTYD